MKKIFGALKRSAGWRHYSISNQLKGLRWPFLMGSGQRFPMSTGFPRGRVTPPGGGWTLPATGANRIWLRRFREIPGRSTSLLFIRCRFSYDSAIGMRHSSTVDDHALIQIVDAALAEVTRRSGKWLVCRPGCSQCCIGAFPINQLDARRLRLGLEELETTAPARALAIRARAQEAVVRLSPTFPGDPVTGLLRDGDAAADFSDFANDEPCPVLDPVTGTCELYESRPITCRVFGPPVRSEDGLGVCELCFQGASDAEIAAHEMKPDPDDLESALLEKLERTTGDSGNTIIAFCLASS
jgi:Fe-S-cluster containining protein